MTYPQPDATALPALSPRARGLSALESVSSAADTLTVSPTETVALKARLSAQLAELNEEADENDEPEISSRAQQAALDIAFFALADCFAGPRPSVFSNESGGVILTFQNKKLRRRLSVEVPASATHYDVTALDLAKPPSGQESSRYPAQPPNLSKLLHWVCADER